MYHHSSTGASIYLNGTLLGFRFLSFSLVVFLNVDLMMASSLADIRGLISGFGERCKSYHWLLGFRGPILGDSGSGYANPIIVPRSLDHYLDGDGRVCWILYESMCGGLTWMLGF